MRKTLLLFGSLLAFSFGFDREFGIKLGYLVGSYDSVYGGDKDINSIETFSVYGALSSEAPYGFTAGLSLELVTSNDFDDDTAWSYTGIELNPFAQIQYSEKLNFYAGFGPSINRFKEKVGSSSSESTTIGIQFMVGGKYRIGETTGLILEYKLKNFITGDYDNTLLHHVNVGLFFSF
ncbi:hypothetical protein JCM9492_10160 [Aquifex pyrophilus]